MSQVIVRKRHAHRNMRALVIRAFREATSAARRAKRFLALYSALITKIAQYQGLSQGRSVSLNGFGDLRTPEEFHRTIAQWASESQASFVSKVESLEAHLDEQIEVLKEEAQ